MQQTPHFACFWFRTGVTSKLLSGRTAPYLEGVAAGSNFASEYPLLGYLLDFDI